MMFEPSIRVCTTARNRIRFSLVQTTGLSGEGVAKATFHCKASSAQHHQEENGRDHHSQNGRQQDQPPTPIDVVHQLQRDEDERQDVKVQLVTP